MTTVTITAVSRKQRVSKAGKPFTSLGLKTVEYGDKWLSGFDSKNTASWKEGDTVEIEIEQKGDYLNFSIPRKDSSPARSSDFEYKVTTALELILSELKALRKNDSSYPEMNASNNASVLDEPPF